MFVQYTPRSFEELIDILERKLGVQFCNSVDSTLKELRRLQMFGVSMELSITCSFEWAVKHINEITEISNISEIIQVKGYSGHTFVHLSGQQQQPKCFLTIFVDNNKQ